VFLFFSSILRHPLVGQSLVVVEPSRSHSVSLHSVGLLWRSDQPETETSTWQHTTLRRDKYPCNRRDSNPHIQKANSRRPTPYTARPLGSALSYITEIKTDKIQFIRYKLLFLSGLLHVWAITKELQLHGEVYEYTTLYVSKNYLCLFKYKNMKVRNSSGNCQQLSISECV